jgi:hypothetical protein
MRLGRFISSTPIIACLLAGLLFAFLVIPLNAGDLSSRYDVTKEVTLSGTVSSVLRKPAPGMVWGSHLMVETSFGRLDASLGRFGLEGKGALSVTPGQRIELTGVMRMVRDKEVFVVRSVKADGKIFTMRNEHGLDMSPLARERAVRNGVAL